MIRRFTSLATFVLSMLLLLSVQTGQLAQSVKEIPREWIDPDTGHRVKRLSDEPGSASLYFHMFGPTHVFAVEVAKS